MLVLMVCSWMMRFSGGTHVSIVVVVRTLTRPSMISHQRSRSAIFPASGAR